MYVITDFWFEQYSVAEMVSVLLSRVFISIPFILLNLDSVVEPVIRYPCFQVSTVLLKWWDFNLKGGCHSIGICGGFPGTGNVAFESCFNFVLNHWVTNWNYSHWMVDHVLVVVCLFDWVIVVEWVRLLQEECSNLLCIKFLLNLYYVRHWSMLTFSIWFVILKVEIEVEVE